MRYRRISFCAAVAAAVFIALCTQSVSAQGVGPAAHEALGTFTAKKAKYSVSGLSGSIVGRFSDWFCRYYDAVLQYKDRFLENDPSGSVSLNLDEDGLNLLKLAGGAATGLDLSWIDSIEISATASDYTLPDPRAGASAAFFNTNKKLPDTYGFSGTGSLRLNGNEVCRMNILSLFDRLYYRLSDFEENWNILEYTLIPELTYSMANAVLHYDSWLPEPDAVRDILQHLGDLLPDRFTEERVYKGKLPQSFEIDEPSLYSGMEFMRGKTYTFCQAKLSRSDCVQILRDAINVLRESPAVQESVKGFVKLVYEKMRIPEGFNTEMVAGGFFEMLESSADDLESWYLDDDSNYLCVTVLLDEKEQMSALYVSYLDEENGDAPYYDDLLVFAENEAGQEKNLYLQLMGLIFRGRLDQTSQTGSFEAGQRNRSYPYDFIISGPFVQIETSAFGLDEENRFGGEASLTSPYLLRYSDVPYGLKLIVRPDASCPSISLADFSGSYLTIKPDTDGTVLTEDEIEKNVKYIQQSFNRGMGMQPFNYIALVNRLIKAGMPETALNELDINRLIYLRDEFF